MTIITNKSGKFYDVPDNDKFWIKQLSRSVYQVRNLEYVKSLKSKFRTIVDVGANVGSNSVEYATFCEKLISFEPTPETYKHLCATLALNASTNIADVTLENIGIADAPGTLYIHCYSNNCGKNFVTSEKSNRSIAVEIRTLDSYELQDVDFIKIDVEGFEYKVIQGALNTIKRYRPIIQTEFIEEHMNRAGSTCAEVEDLMKSLGYAGKLRTGLDYSFEAMKKSRITDVFWISQ